MSVQEKNEKKPQAFGLTVCAAGSGSVAAIKDGIHARGARVIRQPPPVRRYHTGRRSHGARLAPAGANCPVAVTSRTACSAVACVPFAVRKHVSGAVCIRFPADGWEFEAKPQQLFWYLFSLWRKVHIFSFVKEKRVLFLFGQEKNEKKPQAFRLTVCATGSGSMAAIKRRHPRSRSSRDPSTAAMFVDITPEGAHTARALRLRARTAQPHVLPARRVPPWVYASRQKHESPRRESR